MTKLKVGVAMCGSYCTYAAAMPVIEKLTRIYDVVPIMSENAASTDTRFGAAADHINRLEEMTGREVIRTIKAAEPVGPRKLLDALLILPCTGNTLAKMANGITDTSVTMTAKAQLRNGRPVVIALATNDGLGANAENIGKLMARENVYFVPFFQDGPSSKENSLQSDFELSGEALASALEGRQLQPVLVEGTV